MTDRELMQMALDALEWCYDVTEWPANGESPQDKAIEALRARLAQPEQEPWKCGCGANLYIDENGKPRSKVQPEQEPVAKYSDIVSDGGLDPRNKFDTTPPQREWQGLTAAEQIDFINGAVSWIDVICAIEAKLKEKNR